MVENTSRLREVIQENIRTQKNKNKGIEYIGVGNVLADAGSMQNHVIFGRRGCGKSLLLHYSAQNLKDGGCAVYLNCEDFKRHSFPNVLVEILDAIFAEIESKLSGFDFFGIKFFGWFNEKKRSRDIVKGIRKKLHALKEKDDVIESFHKNKTISETKKDFNSSLLTGAADLVGLDLEVGLSKKSKNEYEEAYKSRVEKLQHLDHWLPELKRDIRKFFEASNSMKYLFLQIDDLYHLKRNDQSFVVDYVHRLCKDLPLFFKIATLRHASVLYLERNGQPIGIQERHDFQSIDIDYTFIDFKKTCDQNEKIFKEFGKKAGFDENDVGSLFRGEGFQRLVLAGGGVPRDVLSLFIEALEGVEVSGDGKIGKDDVRILSKANFERRIEELKNDSDGDDQEGLIKAIYAIRNFCLEKMTNVFLIEEKNLQQNHHFNSLIYRLLDYRIIHRCAVTLTHKSRSGTYQAFAIDIGCYAHLRRHQGKFKETDLSASDAKEKLRSVPLLELDKFKDLLDKTPEDTESHLMDDDS